jgi:hypothetical protein
MKHKSKKKKKPTFEQLLENEDKRLTKLLAE